jgi:cation diffusion facilitator family transporter
MHADTIDAWTHEHHFIPKSHHESERRTWWVIGVTATMMVVEVVSGNAFGSMALTADGWHMASHVSALAITVFAYRYARRHASDSQYSFGTGKVSVLGGYTSAVVLAVIALWIGWQASLRLFSGVAIRFNEAILVATLGLVINLLCALLLREHHDGGEDGAGHDHNLRAAYLHVLADGLTSVFAVFALVCGKLLGWVWMDPLMGIVGALVIARWSWGLLAETSRVLLDGSGDPELLAQVRSTIERGSDRVADLHLWHVGPHQRAAILSVVTDDPDRAAAHRTLLHEQFGFAHVTLEIRTCPRHEPHVRPQPIQR